MESKVLPFIKLRKVDELLPRQFTEVLECVPSCECAHCKYTMELYEFFRANGRANDLEKFLNAITVDGNKMA